MKIFIGLLPLPVFKTLLNQSLLLCLLFGATHSHAALMPGQLIISEVMANPAAVSDTVGEWFELFNATGEPIDLNGLSFYDSGSNSHTISESLFIQAGAYLVLGRNSDSSSNGGLSVDYVYSNFTLGNSSDDIFIEWMGVQLAAVSYNNDGIFGVAGISAEWLGNGYGLTADGLGYGAGDIGTPGSQGSYAIPPASPVPVPAAGWLMASGLCSLLLAKKRKILK